MKFLASFVLLPAILLVQLAPAIHAQARIDAPVMGYAFDASVQRLRPISGFPGASLIDGPADLGVVPALAAVSPRQDFILLSSADDGSVRLVSLPSLDTRNMEGAGGSPTRILLSPGASAAGLFQQAPARIQILTHIPEAPAVAREISLAGISGDVNSAAISDDGELALLLSGSAGDISAWLSVGGGDPVPFGLPATAAVVAFRNGSHQAIVVTKDGQVALVPDPTAGPDARFLSPADTHTADPAAVRFSADGSSVYIATRGGSIAALNIDTGDTRFASCGCNPSGLFPLRTSTLFRLNEISGDPLMLVDVTGAELRTWFVPALARSAQ